ncbi:hypothetical protein KAI31_02910, partial [Candidatus Bathyarchaeota archaeon]|nr:hypothetical protein [Candidatus Bathyarchaeota archaeon]
MNYVVDISAPSASDGSVTGGKGSNLAKLVRIVGRENVPHAIMVTTKFAKALLNNEKIIESVDKLDEKLTEGNEKAAEKIAAELNEEIQNMEIPKELSNVLIAKVNSMKQDARRHRVAVRSSGVTEDLPTAAFAGQFETYLNVPLDSNVIKYVLKCIASAYGWRVVDYRNDLTKKRILNISEVELVKKGIISVIIQVMVDSEKAGVAFSIDPDTG